MIPDADLLGDLERLRLWGGWRGACMQLRGGSTRALARVPASDLRALALALRAAASLPGRVVTVHTPTCRRRDDRCRCAGARLVAGARA